MTIDKEFNNIINKLSSSYNVDTEVIEKVIKSQFRFVKDTIEQGELQSVHLHYLGKFAVYPNRIKKLEEDNYIPRKESKRSLEKHDK